MTVRRFSLTQVALHWLSVLLLLGLAGTGLAYSFDLAEKGALMAHQAMGQALILLLVARLATRLSRRPLAGHPEHARWERAASVAVHLGLYATMIAFVATGYVAASALRDSGLLWPLDIGFARSDTGEALTEVHYALKWVLLVLVAVHVIAALKHHFIDRDDTLSQMTFSSR